MKILFLVLFWGIFIQAQQSDLVNNTWYLEKLTINNVDYPHPNTIAGAIKNDRQFLQKKMLKK